jgi:competence protein ComGC
MKLNYLTDRRRHYFRPRCRAFNRIELLAVCACLGLLSLLVAPTLASNKTDSERLVCFNNLRLIGRGVQMFAGDHNQQPPWRSPQADGGLFPSSGSRPGVAWYDFSYISNELATPRILACPSDAGVKRAVEFGGGANGGFVSLAFRALALSYVIGLESVGDAPKSWVSGDRNLGEISGSGGCSARVTSINSISTSPGTSLGWTNGVAHNEFGHILLMDGSVEFTSSTQLKQILLSPQADDNGTIHFLKAR